MERIGAGSLGRPLDTDGEVDTQGLGEWHGETNTHTHTLNCTELDEHAVTMVYGEADVPAVVVEGDSEED